jgi:hypothetical protein
VCVIFQDSFGQRGRVPEGGGRGVEHPLRQAGQDCQERGQSCPLQASHWRRRYSGPLLCQQILYRYRLIGK